MAGAPGQGGFIKRLTRSVLDPTLLGVPVAVAVFVPLSSHHLIAALPIWFLALLLVGAYVLSAYTTALCPPGSKGWKLNVRVSVEIGVIALVIYAIGWGPTLALALIFGLIDCMRTHGHEAARPALLTGVAVIVLGQLAIVSGVAPTLVRPPLVNAQAVLAAVAFILTAKLLEWVFRGKEDAQSKLLANERRFKALVQHAADAIVVFQDGRFNYASPAFTDVLGYDAEKVSELEGHDLIHPDDLDRLSSLVESSAANPAMLELRLRTEEGTWRWFDVRLADRRDDPDIRGLVANLRDIDERKRTERALQDAHEHVHSAFENAPIGMALVDLEGKVIRANPAYGHILGRGASELGKTTLTELTHPDDREMTATQIRNLINGESEGYRTEKRCLHALGDELWVSASISCVRGGDDKPLYLIDQIEDITERRALREHLTNAALHDPLTGLPNRTLFLDRLQTALRRTVRRRNHVAVIFLDIDHFKRVNDSFGHDGGDHLLRAVANRVRDSVRPADTVARFGGDEFTILCEDVSNETEGRELARRIAAGLERAFGVGEAQTFVTASLGLALGNFSVTPEHLIRDADTAMYRAKEHGRARIEVCNETDDLWSAARLRMGNELHLAVHREEFELHYQPFVDLHTFGLVGLEALVRWRHPTRGLLLPDEFIDLAEENALIEPIGHWVLYEACRQASEWRETRQRAGEEAWPIAMSVNVSPRQLANRSFPSDMEAILRETGMDADGVWLEITESTLLRDPDQAVATLGALRGLGVHISVDDFGTGYSSLSYLQQLPVECLKIDRTFVDGIGQANDSSAIVKAVVALADSLDLACIAEGVERPSQARAITALGCSLAQGYMFGRPMPAELLGPAPSDDLSSWNSEESLTGLEAV